MSVGIGRLVSLQKQIRHAASACKARGAAGRSWMRQWIPINCQVVFTVDKVGALKDCTISSAYALCRRRKGAAPNAPSALRHEQPRLRQIAERR